VIDSAVTVMAPKVTGTGAGVAAFAAPTPTPTLAPRKRPIAATARAPRAHPCARVLVNALARG